MQPLPSIVCAVLVALVCIESGLALQCYDCNSDRESACKDVKANQTEFLITCPVESVGCRKVEQRLTYNNEDHIRYYRQCATTAPEKQRCRERSGTKGVKMFYCTCNTDGCNSGSSSTLSFTLLAATISSIILYKKL